VLPVYISVAGFLNGVCLSVYSGISGYVELLVTACFIAAISLVTVIIYVIYMIKNTKASAPKQAKCADKIAQCVDEGVQCTEGPMDTEAREVVCPTLPSEKETTREFVPCETETAEPVGELVLKGNLH